MMKKENFFGSNNEKWECIGKTSEVFENWRFCILYILLLHDKLILYIQVKHKIARAYKIQEV